MPLVDSRGFNLNPVRDNSPLADGIFRLIHGVGERQQQNKIAEAEKLQLRLEKTGAQLLRVRNMADSKNPQATFQSQRKELFKLAQEALKHGEDIDIYEEATKIQEPDKLNLFLTRHFTRAKDAKKILDEHTKRQAAPGDSDPNFSIETEITPSGGAIQTDSDGNVVVRDASNRVLEGQERIEFLEQERKMGFESKQKAADLQVDTARKVAGAKARQARISEITKEQSGRSREAARSETKLRNAETLIGQAEQGVSAGLKLKAARLFPDIDVSSEGALQAAFTDLALDSLQRLKGPSTDFEFIKMESIGGQITDPKSANLARVKSLQRNNWFIQREGEQFRKHVKAGGDPDNFIFNFNEVIHTKKGSFTLQQLQDTAVHNNISIDDALERLNQ